MTPKYESLTSNRLLARNVGMNFVGWGLPAIAAFVAIPFLIHQLGDARFGVLALAWTALGYFSLFDLGIGRALTYAVSERLGTGRHDEVPRIIWTSVGLLAPLGVAGGLVLYALAPWLTTSALRVPLELQSETALSFKILAIALPFTTVTAALRGALEASQRFGLVNALRVPYGLLTFLGPLAALPFSSSVVPAIVILAVGRILLSIGHLVACAASIPGFKVIKGERAMLRPLLTFGGWMTVSNIISPLMNTLDRFVVGAAIALGAVTFYVTPHEVVTKMWLYAAAVFPVFFPAFASTVVREPARTAALFDRMQRATLVILFLPTLVLVAMAPEILVLWLGPEFGAESASVMRVLAIAVFVNSLAQGALTLIHAAGRPDLTGKYHVAELPVYALLLWILLPRYGIVGVAWAWALRATLDAAILFLTCPRLVRETGASVQRIGLWTLGLLPVLAAFTIPEQWETRAALVALAVPAWIALAWFRMLTPGERMLPVRLLRATPTAE